MTYNQVKEKYNNAVKECRAATPDKILHWMKEVGKWQRQMIIFERAIRKNNRNI